MEEFKISAWYMQWIIVHQKYIVWLNLLENGSGLSLDEKDNIPALHKAFWVRHVEHVDSFSQGIIRDDI